jgi:hypothetical protein
MSHSAKEIRSNIIETFYENSYANYLFGKSIQASGISYFERSLEKRSNLTISLIRQLELGSGWLTWVFATEAIPKVEEKFGRSAIEGHRTRPDGSDLKWKQIGVNEIADSRELPFFIQWLTADHPSQDGKAVAAIEKITIADSDQLSDSWFKTEILAGLNGTDLEFIDPATNDGESGIVAVHLVTPGGVVRLD